MTSSAIYCVSHALTTLVYNRKAFFNNGVFIALHILNHGADADESGEPHRHLPDHQEPLHPATRHGRDSGIIYIYTRILLIIIITTAWDHCPQLSRQQVSLADKLLH